MLSRIKVNSKIFALQVTIYLISMVHLYFKAMAFKNNVEFWLGLKKEDSYL